MESLDQSAGPRQAGSVTGNLAKYTSALLFCRFAAVVQGFVIIRLMDPAVLGVWLGLQLIPIYGVHAHFGMLNAVNRQIPFYRGRGDLARAVNVEQTARGNLTLLAAAYLCVPVVLFLLGYSRTDVERGSLLLIVATAVNILFQFYAGLFRARNEFGKAGLANVINAIVILVGLILVYHYGFDGLLWRAVAVAVLSLLGCVVMDRWSWKMRFDRRETGHLLKIGLPIMILSYGIVVFSSMDRTLILVFLDDRAMGEYALCFAIARVVTLFPSLVGQVYYPRMTELYASTGLSRALLKTCGQASLLSAVVAGAVCLTSYMALPPLVETWFPKYAAGLPALYIALIAYFLLSLSGGPNYFLISTVQKRRQFVVLLGAAGVMTLAAAFLSADGLIGIAWSLVLGVTGYVVGLWGIVLNSYRRPRAQV